ncbi:hypothetical protein ACFQGT_15985 [Natrialbaceae archaeon GCM10025810]|uniref:hypothetical protein n=1 Tax=Halovalidus salilacus TaxID=3075124 RepID=UPI00361862FE
MVDSDLVEFVTRSLRDDTRETFERRVDEQADRLRDALRGTTLDSPGFGLGIELEAYAIDEAGRLARVPEQVLAGPCARELGVHNVELNTVPDRFDDAGIAEQERKLRRALERTRAIAREHDAEVVADAMWTTPPTEGTAAYLGDVEEADGVTVARNMTGSPRYHAIDNHIVDEVGGAVSLEVPGVERAFPTILFESLTCSIQPHLQVPEAASFPRYYNAALATLPPVLALSTNAPLLPPDLYGDDTVADPDALLEETHHELRIPVFEASVNGAWEKARVPNRIDRPTDVVDRLVADPTCAPVLREWVAEGGRETFGDRFWELDHKRGTYWRWVRAVAGGQPVGRGDRRSIRLEYRPLPTQPTIDDSIALLCLVVGLVHGLVVADHPAIALERDEIERGFYDAAANGLEADVPWRTADGEPTTDPDAIYDEAFALARRGLRDRGVSAERIDAAIGAFEDRWERRRTPSRWKLERVRERLEAGATFDDAVRGMQAAYVDRSGAGTPFSEWP